ncbi:MRG-domain-containing protein [Coemansia reversa NRRL 1564]|uniref:Chromatin modification-related protein EAF3 n=1 Tax=Coemansia reversa (strain ATCC 12441 / NRRL 1564) TaxID=763665 RepID=A0A2G5BKW7_COERN|nr:MRG-domain-containing protein [Coemansia reversa NRRL 1564]|eukprot:PIA19648.1 MRG-domain-containing protein [Coemansia reversa NRRL 1564]
MTEKSGGADEGQSLMFKVNERILCFHGPLLYEAKVVKAEMWDGSDPDAPEPGPHYFVHYKGWKQTWDEWVDESRAMKFNEENLAKQKALKQAALQSAGKRSIVVASKHTSRIGSETESSQPQYQQQQQQQQRSRKRARESSVEKTRDEREESLMKSPEIKISIPNALKAQLVDDWERITKDKLLVPLPRSPTVAEMLGQYLEYRRSSKDKRRSGRRNDDDIVDEIIEGLKLYFNKALGNILLYRFERYQYKQLCEKHSDKTPSEIYGCEHLLRLFVQLPALIAHTNMDEEAVQVLKEHMGDVLKYMHKFSKSLFVDEYENASPAYVAVAKGT